MWGGGKMLVFSKLEIIAVRLPILIALQCICKEFGSNSFFLLSECQHIHFKNIYKYIFFSQQCAHF